MSWIVNVVIDEDKSKVCSVSAVFTDTDNSTFTATARGEVNPPNGTQFVQEAVNARNQWQARKQDEYTAINNLIVEGFNAMTPVEDADGPATPNSGSVTISLPT